MSFRIQIEGGDSFTANADESLLEAAERAGLPLAHDCRMGGCGSCRIKLLDGQVAYAEQPFALSSEEEAQGYALACQARACGDLLIAPGNGLDLPPTQCVEAVIQSVQAVCAQVLHLVLETPEPVPYLPGQYMNVVLPDGSTRSFSMANANGGRRLEFHVKRVPGGRFTELALQQARPGERLQLQLPLGSFCLRRQDYRPLLMVATGTGIAPIRAILESLLDDADCPPVWLYWGMRSQDDLWLAEELESWRERLYEFEFVPVLSRAGTEWQGRRGHVQEAVAQDFDDLSEHAIYLCGAPEMVRQAKDIFLARGASAAHLYADSFNYAHQLADQAAA